MNIALVEPLGIKKKLLLNFKEKVESLNHNFTYYNSKPQDQNDLKKRIENQDIIMIANYPLTIETLKTNSNLKYIAVAFTGLDHIPLNYCNEKKIKITNCNGYSSTAVSEQVIGMTLSLLRHIHLNNKAIRKEKNNLYYGVGEEIKGKTIGIIGLGNIGLETAKLFDAFGANVIYYSRTEKKVKYQYTNLDDLLKNSDIITLHIPYNENTYHFLNKEKLDLIKKDAIIINTARGNIIDNDYLIELLNNDRISGAAIDVFDYEPPLKKDYPLLNAKNTLLTPHTGFLTKEALLKRAKIEFDNVLNFLNMNN